MGNEKRGEKEVLNWNYNVEKSVDGTGKEPYQ